MRKLVFVASLQVFFCMFTGVWFVIYCWSRASCTYTSAWPVTQPACQPVVDHSAAVDQVCKAARWIRAAASGLPDRHSERLLDTYTAAAIGLVVWLPARCLGYTTWWYTDRNLKGQSLKWLKLV